MLFKIGYVFVIACLASPILASPTAMVSYIQDIQVSYENGRWLCGILGCPVAPSDPALSIMGSFGCRVQRKTNADDNTKLNTTYTCFNNKKRPVGIASFTTDMYRSRDIDIDLESYDGAVSVYFTGYGYGGTETSKGVVAPDGWTELKEYAAENKKVVEESNSLFDIHMKR